MADKAERTRARLPRGFVDRMPEDIRASEEMMGRIRAVYELYGFEPVEQPMIEYTDALGKFLPDQDRPNEGVFSFQDDDDQWLSLRYDLTAPLARFVAENFEKLPKPYRSYRQGWVFRNEKPGPGRFRQFMQFDADIVGSPGVTADAEMAMMMADTLEAVGIARGDYVIRVNNRALLDAIFRARGIGDDQKIGVLRSLDKFDKFGWEQVYLLLTIGRLDESGDFTKGVGLAEHTARLLYRLFAEIEVASHPDEPLSFKIGREDVSFPQTKIEVFSQYKVDGKSIFSEDAVRSGDVDWLLPLIMLLTDPVDGSQPDLLPLAQIFEIYRLVRIAGYGPDRIRIDPSVVRGLEYYTGPVYEAELTFPVTNEKGETVRFGSVAGGGRYDGLVKRFTGQDVPATGFSIGVSRLMTALKNLGKLDDVGTIAPVVVLVMDRDTESLGRYQKMVASLRAAGIRAEMYLGGSGMKAQMKYADRRGSPCVVIQGGDEREKGEVEIKDLVAGARASAEITDNTEWRESRPAQFSVKEDDLVEAVRGVIDAQAAERG